MRLKSLRCPISLAELPISVSHTQYVQSKPSISHQIFWLDWMIRRPPHPKQMSRLRRQIAAIVRFTLEYACPCSQVLSGCRGMESVSEGDAQDKAPQAYFQAHTWVFLYPSTTCMLTA